MREHSVPCAFSSRTDEHWHRTFLDDGICQRAVCREIADRRNARSAVPVVTPGHRGAHLYSHTPASLGALQRVHQIVAQSSASPAHLSCRLSAT